MGRPKGLGARIAVVVGKRISERSGWTVAHLRVAIEPGQDVARRRTAQSHERRQRCADAEREQDDAADANSLRRELPGARPRGGEKQDGDRDGEHKRRPDALNQKRASRPSRKLRESSLVDRWGVLVLHRDAMILR